MKVLPFAKPGVRIRNWHHALLLLYLFFPYTVSAGVINTDSLESILTAHPRDTASLRHYIDAIEKVRSVDMLEAEALGEKAIAMAKRSDDLHMLGHAYNNAANTLSQGGKFNEALESYHKAIAVYQKENSRPELAKVYMNIGSCYLHMQNHEQAEPWLLKAKKNTPADAPSSHNSILNNNLALVYSFRGEYDKAISMHYEALTAEIERNDYRSQALSLNNIGYAHQQMGQHFQALSHYRRAYAVARTTEYKLITAYTVVSLIDGLVHNKLYAEADLMVDTLQGLAHESNALNLVAEVYKTVAGVYQEQGKYKEALEQYELYIALHDSLLNEDQNAKIAALQNKMEVAEKDAEIDLMSREKAAEEDVSSQRMGYILALVGGLLVATVALILLAFSSRDRKRANQELQLKNKLVQEQYQALQLSNERLADLNREKDGLIGIVAHDLKSPLNKSAALTELIGSVGPLNDSQLRALDMIRKVTEHGNDLIRDLLDLNSIEHPDSAIQFEAVNLEELFQEGAASFEAAARQKDIRIHWHAPREDQLVETDRKALNRILENLVSNAIKFSPRGKAVWVEARIASPDMLRISVRDEGPGISTEDRKKLFKKFQRLSARPTGGENSTGLGLAITKTLVEKLNGNISIDSKPGMGAEFTVTLPRQVAGA